MSAAEQIRTIRAEIRDEYLQTHDRPWIVGYSAGKDSTALLHLVVEVVLSVPAQRSRKLVVSMGDTLVENPVMQAHADKMWSLLQEYVPRVLPGVAFVRTVPKESETFWVLLLGRGYRAPTRDFRWCTDRMKIKPKRNLFAAYPRALWLVGTRRDESQHRNAGFDRSECRGRILERGDGTATYAPLEHLTTDDLWAFLLQNPPPWGGSHRDLITLYRNAVGECPVVISKDDAPSCGSQSARFGCWTCTVVKKDKSLGALADGEDGERLEPLIAFRDRLRDVSDDPKYRATRRRNGQPGNGPLTLPARRMLLDELLVVQEEVGQQLISDREIELIRETWARDGERTPLTTEELSFSSPISLPALSLSQGGNTHYQARITFSDLVRVCRVPEERPSAEDRYQRDASWKRAEEISDYVRKNRDTYVFPPLTICVESPVYAAGSLTLRPDCRTWLVDGQHRRAAVEMILELDRTLESEEVGICVHPFENVDQLRQLFADLNSGKSIPRSVRLFMNRRTLSDALSASEAEPFAGWVDPVNTTVTKRSPYLWTLSALEQTKGISDNSWWISALSALSGVSAVREGRISAAVARQRYVWAHGVGLRALGECVGIVEPALLACVDWDRKSACWEGNACQKGKMLASNVVRTAAEIQRQVGASLSFDVLF